MVKNEIEQFYDEMEILTLNEVKRIKIKKLTNNFVGFFTLSLKNFTIYFDTIIENVNIEVLKTWKSVR